MGFKFATLPICHGLCNIIKILGYCAWTKTFHQMGPTTVQYAWEAVLLHGGRKDNIFVSLWLEIGC
jgi:hypothetical protein